MSNPDYTDADGTHYTWIQATGYVQTLAVDDIRKGDVLAYNYAGSGVVVDVRPASRCFVTITSVEKGRVFQHRRKLGTRVPHWRRGEVVPTLSGPIPEDAPRRTRELDLRVVEAETVDPVAEPESPRRFTSAWLRHQLTTSREAVARLHARAYLSTVPATAPYVSVLSEDDARFEVETLAANGRIREACGEVDGSAARRRKAERIDRGVSALEASIDDPTEADRLKARLAEIDAARERIARGERRFPIRDVTAEELAEEDAAMLKSDRDDEARERLASIAATGDTEWPFERWLAASGAKFNPFATVVPVAFALLLAWTAFTAGQQATAHCQDPDAARKARREMEILRYAVDDEDRDDGFQGRVSPPADVSTSAQPFQEVG